MLHNKSEVDQVVAPRERCLWCTQMYNCSVFELPMVVYEIIPWWRV